MRMNDIAKQYCALHIYTKDTYDTVLRISRLFDERSGITELSDITLDALVRYRTDMMNREVSAATYNGYLRYLRLLGRYAHEQGLLSQNIFLQLGFMPEPRRGLSDKAVSTERVQDAIDWLRAHDGVNPGWFWALVIQFLFYHGVRRRQLCALRVGDLDMDSRVVRLRHQSSKTNREWYIPFHRDCVDGINDLLSKYGHVTPEDQLFNVCRLSWRYRSVEMTPHQVTDAFKRLYKLSGIRVGAQRLRHTTATEICNSHEDGETPDLFAAQYLLGHTMLSTTRGYVKPRISAVRRSTERSLQLRG